MRKNEIKLLTTQGKECIRDYSGKVIKASFLPLVSIPLVHSLCVAMLRELDKIFDVSPVKDEKLSNIAIGVLATPFMMVPIWGAIAAKAYVETVGESYLKALIDIAYTLENDGIIFK